MIAEMMLELEADAVCMNEVDSCTSRSNWLYQPKELAEKMGKWNYYFGKAIPSLGGSYGNAMVVSPKFKENRILLSVLKNTFPSGAGQSALKCKKLKLYEEKTPVTCITLYFLGCICRRKCI